LIARHLEPCEGEDSRKHYDVKRTHELTHATGSSLNSKTGLRGKDNSKKYENNRGFAISNVPTFGFSPRSPSKYRKFKSDREIRRNTLKENALENEKKLLNEFDCDDSWLVTPMEASAPKVGKQREIKINEAKKSRIPVKIKEKYSR